MALPEIVVVRIQVVAQAIAFALLARCRVGRHEVHRAAVRCPGRRRGRRRVSGQRFGSPPDAGIVTRLTVAAKENRLAVRRPAGGCRVDAVVGERQAGRRRRRRLPGATAARPAGQASSRAGSSSRERSGLSGDSSDREDAGGSRDPSTTSGAATAHARPRRPSRSTTAAATRAVWRRAYAKTLHAIARMRARYYPCSRRRRSQA